MGAPGEVPEGIQKLAIILIYIFGAMFGIGLIVVLGIVALNLARIISFPGAIDLQAAFTVFAFCIALLCIVMWIMNQIGTLTLKDGTEKMIRNVLIVALLASVATGIKNVVSG